MNPILTAVLAYLKLNNYRRASFDRLIGSVEGISTETQLHDLVRNNPQIFLSVTIAGGCPGLRLRDSFNGIIPETAPAAPTMNAEELPQPTTDSPVNSAPQKPCNVTILIQRAADARFPSEAVQFSQAALNTATARAYLSHANSFRSMTVGVASAD